MDDLGVMERCALEVFLRGLGGGKWGRWRFLYLDFDLF